MDALLRIREIARKEIRQLLRDPRTRAMIFVSPILQLLLLGYAVTTDVRRLPTFVVDRDATPESRLLTDAFEAGGYFLVVGRSDRASDLTAALDGGDAEVALEIPVGFARDVRAGHATVQVILDGSNSNTATIAQGYATRIVQRVAADLADLPPPPIDLRARAWYNPDLTSRLYNVPAVIGALLMLMCLLLTAMAIVREREVGTLEQLVVTPVEAPELILGKTLPVVAIALVDLLLISALAILWFDVPFRGSPLTLLLGAGLYIVTGVSIGLLLSSISRTQQEAFMGMFLIFLPVLILSGLLLPVENMPRIFQVITEANPMRHFLVIVRSIFLKGEGLVTLWRPYVALTILAAGVLGLAVWRTRAILR